MSKEKIIRKNCYIYDARPEIAATVNWLKGKGTENIKYYLNCKLFYLDIQNIHKARDALKKMKELCLDNSKDNK